MAGRDQRINLAARKPSSRITRDHNRGLASKSIPTGQFLQHGKIELILEDQNARQVELRIIMPACVMQAVTPLLLESGLIHEYKMVSPLMAWIPTIAREGFKEDIIQNQSELDSGVNKIAINLAHQILEFFCEASAILKFPTDLVPLLPMGTYIEFQYRCSIDKLAITLEKISESNIAGIPEFRYAMAGILVSILKRWDSL
jgi:hypothetical protein